MSVIYMIILRWISENTRNENSKWGNSLKDRGNFYWWEDERECRLRWFGFV